MVIREGASSIRGGTREGVRRVYSIRDTVYRMQGEGAYSDPDFNQVCMCRSGGCMCVCGCGCECGCEGVYVWVWGGVGVWVHRASLTRILMRYVCANQGVCVWVCVGVGGGVNVGVGVGVGMRSVSHTGECITHRAVYHTQDGA